MSTELEEILTCRISKRELDDLKKKHPYRGDVSHIIRGLLQMYLSGEIKKVKLVREF